MSSGGSPAWSAKVEVHVQRGERRLHSRRPRRRSRAKLPGRVGQLLQRGAAAEVQLLELRQPPQRRWQRAQRAAALEVQAPQAPQTVVVARRQLDQVLEPAQAEAREVR